MKITKVYPQGKDQHGNGCGLPLNDSFFQRGYGNMIVIRCPQCKRENNYFKEMITINPVKAGMKCWWCGYEDCGEGEPIKMKIDYLIIKEKKPCRDGYLWFLEKFGKESIDIDLLINEIKKEKPMWEEWVNTHFAKPKYDSTDFYGIHAWRNEKNDIYEFHLNGSICKAHKLENIDKFPKASFLPVKNVMDVDRYMVLGARAIYTYQNDMKKYLFFYDTKFCMTNMILHLAINIEKVYWEDINLGSIFFDIPLYSHFDNKFCRSESVDYLERGGKI